MSGVCVIPVLMLIPLVYVVVKKQMAASSLQRLIGSRFPTAAAVPVQQLSVPRGGALLVHSAYASAFANGEPFVLLLANWRRSRSAFIRVAGVYLPRSPGPAWLERAARANVLIAMQHGAGALIAWPELASGPSVSGHLEQLARDLGMALMPGRG